MKKQEETIMTFSDDIAMLTVPRLAIMLAPREPWLSPIEPVIANRRTPKCRLQDALSLRNFQSLVDGTPIPTDFLGHLEVLWKTDSLLEMVMQRTSLKAGQIWSRWISQNLLQKTTCRPLS
jgi:hypothetical protein